MTLQKTVCAPIATLTLIGSLIGGANATTTIIYDDFEGETPYALGGSTTNTGQTWGGTGVFFGGVETTPAFNPTDSLLKGAGSQQISTITGITFETNCEYTLSMDAFVGVEAGGDATDWLAFGFTTTSFSHAIIGSVGTMLHRANPEVQTFSADSANAQTIAVPAWSGSLQSHSVILTTGSTLADSTVRWEVDGLQVGVAQATDASTVNGVFIHGFEDAFAYVDNYQLTHVPEPSSALLLGLGSVALALRRSRS